jgi:transposase
MNTYFKINQDITRSKNRLKSVFRMKGILCAGQKIYSKANHDDWKKKLTGWSTTQNIAEIYWSQLSMLENQKSVMLSEIKKQSRPFKEIKEFLKLPGVGLVTASTFSAFIVTPWRFKNKAKVWAYCNLSLIENDTGKKLNKEVEMKRQRKILRRLTRDGNRRLKSVLKTAAGVACHRANDNDYKTMYQSLRARGLDESSAMLTISRKLACQLWGIWKRVETNQPIIT